MNGYMMELMRRLHSICALYQRTLNVADDFRASNEQLSLVDLHLQRLRNKCSDIGVYVPAANRNLTS